MLFFILCTLLPSAYTEIISDPEIACSTNGVVVRMAMDRPFRGHMFIRGHYGDERCHRDYRSANHSEQPVMDISFDDCGMRRRRQTNPRGLSVSSTLVVSHHPIFITHEDRAYQIECFYLEESRIVQSGINVSPLQAAEMILHHDLPSCKYSVLLGGPEGNVIGSLKLGDSMYHSWNCSYSKDQLYCMHLHTCTVDDGQGKMHTIVDNAGCSSDVSIFPQIEYTSDLSAGVITKAFKFADHSNVFFQCQIALSLKEKQSSGKCPRPECSHARSRRSLQQTEQTFDVVAEPITVNEFDEAPYSHSESWMEPGSCQALKNALVCLIAVSVASVSGMVCCLVSYLFWRRHHMPKSSLVS